MNPPARYYSADQSIRFKLTTPEEETALFLKAKAGDETARDFLIHNHLLFAKTEGERLAKGALPADEVTSAANYAVMKAFELFKPELGFRFTTYLRHFIRGEISALWKTKFVGGVPIPSMGGPGGGPRQFAEVGAELRVSKNVRDYEDNRFVDETLETAEEIDQEAHNRAVLAEALAYLTAEEATLIQRVHFGGESFADIGRQRGVSRAAVQATHARILIKLRKLMKGQEVHL